MTVSIISPVSPPQWSEFVKVCHYGDFKPGEIRNDEENKAARSLLKDSAMRLGAKKTSDNTRRWPSDGTVFFDNNESVNGVYENMTAADYETPLGADDEMCLLMQESGQWLRDRCDAGNYDHMLCESPRVFVRPAALIDFCN